MRKRINRNWWGQSLPEYAVVLAGIAVVVAVAVAPLGNTVKSSFQKSAHVLDANVAVDVGENNNTPADPTKDDSENTDKTDPTKPEDPTENSDTPKEKTVAYFRSPNDIRNLVVNATTFSRSDKPPASGASNIRDISNDSSTHILIWLDGQGNCYWYSEADEIGFAGDTGYSASGMFSSHTLSEVDLSGIDFSNVTNMESMFFNCQRLQYVKMPQNTSSVTNMSHMFDGCSSLTQLQFPDDMDTSDVTNMNSMFNNCSSLTELDLSSFNTAKVTSMDEMFADCSGLTSLDLSSFNTESVTDMGSMFYGCSGLTVLYGDNFDTTKAGTYDGVTYQKKTV